MGFNKQEYDKASTQILVKFSGDDPVVHALSIMRSKTGEPNTIYLKKALVEKLQKDGFLSPDRQIVIKGAGRRTALQRIRYSGYAYEDSKEHDK